MSDMVEEVARAMLRSRGATQAADELWDQLIADHWDLIAAYPQAANAHDLVTDILRDARAAVEAMKTPTPEMFGAGGVEMFKCDLAAVEPREATGRIYRAMISAALTPPPSGEM